MHCMGDTWSCRNSYTRGEAVPELLGVSVLLDGRIGAFRGTCPRCETVYEIGERISTGKVVKVWPMAVVPRSAIRGGGNGAARGPAARRRAASVSGASSVANRMYVVPSGSGSSPPTA